MTAKYLAILTNQGAARLANAAALGTKLNLTQMAVGDANGTLPTPDPAQTKLINQKRIAPLNLLTVDPANTSQIIAEQIIPENEGGFWIREIGLYDDDGILIAVANCPETYKPQLQEGSGRTQTIRMILIVSSTSSITLKIDPSVVLATRKYADDKAIELKLYVDDLMSKHLAAADPHSQYATKDSPTFTGKPKAPTPPVVANDTQVATAGFVQAVIAALVSGELANKQPLDKTLTDLSGKDVAAILEYLHLGETVRDEFVSCFGATSTAQSVTASSNTAMLCKTVNFDDTGEYNATTGRFVAEHDGTYLFTGSVHGSLGSVSWRILMIYVNGAERFRLQENTSMRCDCAIVGSSVPIKLKAGDYVQLYYNSSVADALNGIVFGGVRIK